jgi:uncharacterized iron-regulated membrane protein
VIRKAIFWTHLVCGVATGLVVLMMSITGVILTYERQMLAAQAPTVADPEPGAERLPLAALVAGARVDDPGFTPTSIAVPSDPHAAVVVSAGRGNSRYIDPYTAERLEEPSAKLAAFFGAVTGWHRWFNADGESRATWRAVTGISNLAFLFLIVSGVYLWLPRVYKWAMFKARLFFHANPTGQARDFNWHHVLGIWTAIPLFVVVATAVVFSYPWASNAVYRVFGEEPPAGRGPPPAAASSAQSVAGQSAADSAAAGMPAVRRAPRLTLDALLEQAAAQVDNWRTITINLPRADATGVSFSIDQGNGGQPQRRHSLTLDAASGAVMAWQPFESQTPGRRARSWVRFLHTGEALGIVGQTVAGLVSLTSVIMVWTGLALAYRRLISPLLRARARR